MGASVVDFSVGMQIDGGASPRTWHEDKAMVQARWNGATIADSDATILLEGNHYFPPDSVNYQFLQESAESTICPWKGTARYYTIRVNGALNPNAAWTYPDPTPEAERIRGHLAFWKGVDIG